MKTKQLTMGDVVAVRASAFLGTPACEAVVNYAWVVDGVEYYSVTGDGETFDIDSEGYVVVDQGSVTRFP
jgi:hypothetical protein